MGYFLNSINLNFKFHLNLFAIFITEKLNFHIIFFLILHTVVYSLYYLLSLNNFTKLLLDPSILLHTKNYHSMKI